MLPSEFLEVNNLPHLKRLLARQVDMLVVDLRTLLHLPQGDFAGCNLTTSAALLNLISGISVCFYNVNRGKFSKSGDSGQRFRDVLRDHYPWTGEVPLGKDGCAILYERARNPLIHRLGVEDPSNLKPGDFREVYFTKRALTESDILLLESSVTRPPGYPPTLIASGAATGVYRRGR